MVQWFKDRKKKANLFPVTKEAEQLSNRAIDIISKRDIYPTKPRPDWDYYWDYEEEKWVHVTDDMDMSWWRGYVDGFCDDKKTPYPPNNKMTGKEWKRLYVPDKPFPKYFVYI